MPCAINLDQRRGQGLSGALTQLVQSIITRADFINNVMVLVALAIGRIQ